MIGHARLLEELGKLVKRSPADATSVCADAERLRVSRFAYETIHQDLVQESLSVTIKVIVNRRVGIAVIDTLEAPSLHRGLRAALAIARHAPPTALLAPLPGPYQHITLQDYDPETADLSPQHFVVVLKRLMQICQGVGATLAGSFTVSEAELAVANSSGVACYTASTASAAKLVTMYRKLSGYASGVEPHINRLDAEALLERALKLCLHRHDPLTLPTGTYEVILEPEAVAELVTWLGYIAFGAKSFQERTSCLAGRMGEALLARSITISDDGNDPEGLRQPFDYEGTAKRKVALIDRGVATGIVYDTTYGHLYGQPSTGHAQPPDQPDGPLPLHLFLEPGTTRREELIRSCRRGLLIPRFHYVSGLLNTREALMTGLTREGTWLIEDGKLRHPVATMRFTQSFLEAFGHVLGISRERRLIADPAQDAGCAVMPTVHLAKFRFTGRSES